MIFVSVDSNTNNQSDAFTVLGQGPAVRASSDVDYITTLSKLHSLHKLVAASRLHFTLSSIDGIPKIIWMSGEITHKARQDW